MQFKKLLHKFPVPEFLNPHFSSMVFSDTKLKVLVLDKRNNHPLFFKEADLPAGIIESGTIQDTGALVQAISEIKSELKSDFVKFAVPDQISYIFSSSVPVYPGKDASEAVSFILEENVPLPLSDISFDFTPVRVKQTENNPTAQMVVTAVSSTTIASYTACLKEAGFEPLLCINESQAIAASVIPRAQIGNSVIICVHSDNVGIYVTRGNLVEFSSILAISPNDSGSFASLVITEFKKVVSYWREKNPNREKSEEQDTELDCYLCGRHDVCKPIINEMSKVPGVRASLANVWVNAFPLQDFIPDISFEDSLRFAGAVGLAI